MQAVAGCMADLRRLGAGESTVGSAVIGLRGLKLTGDRAYELPIGVLRPPTDYERRFSPFFKVGRKVEAVLETSIELCALPEGEAEPEDAGRSEQRLVQIGHAFSLASALAQRGEESDQSAVAVEWITETTPFQGSSFLGPGPVSEPWVSSTEFGEEEVEALATWTERVDAANLSHVEIAVERLLRALFEREPGEALIDAVIAWENLLGTRNETAYRVTVALAVLCEDDPDLRMERRKELATIYDKRSRMVHGDIVGVDSELRDRAIQVGLEAFARLIEDRPGLLELSKSQERVDHLLLAVREHDRPVP
jgi:hypothetical protein